MFYSTFFNILDQEFGLELDLIPRQPADGCPEGTLHRIAYDFDTCSCGQHCNWDMCRLDDPPNECLIGTGSAWQWDALKASWAAQITEGINKLLTKIKLQINNQINVFYHD